MPIARISHLSAALLAGGLGITAAACSSNTSTPPRPTRSAPAKASASASPGAPPATAQAITAYNAMWNTVAKASDSDDFQALSHAGHLAGQALHTITQNIALEAYLGVVSRGAPVVHPLVTSATATSVQLSDCMDDRAWLQYYAATGKPVDDSPGGLRATSATVTDQGGAWNVTEINTGRDGSCSLPQ